MMFYVANMYMLYPVWGFLWSRDHRNQFGWSRQKLIMSESHWQDIDWKCLVFNEKTEIENYWDWIKRPRLRLKFSESQCSLMRLVVWRWQRGLLAVCLAVFSFWLVLLRLILFSIFLWELTPNHQISYQTLTNKPAQPMKKYGQVVKYQPSGAGGTHSPPAMPQRLQRHTACKI